LKAHIMDKAIDPAVIIRACDEALRGAQTLVKWPNSDFELKLAVKIRAARDMIKSWEADER